MNDIDKAIADAVAEIARLSIEEDPADPETGFQICSLMCKRYALCVVKVAGNWIDEDKYQRTLQEWEKRRAAAESYRKNRLLPQIIKKLEAVQGTSSAIAEHSNVPVFEEADE